jgi:hypothetical protein
MAGRQGKLKTLIYNILRRERSNQRGDWRAESPTYRIEYLGDVFLPS